MSPIDVSSQDLLALLREQFGFETFRPGQERVIRDLLKGRDVLAVLSTGAGKSLTYQLTAQFLPGTTIVISPLIALMKDQVGALEEKGVSTGVINSTLTEGEASSKLREVMRGESKLLYVTPERFADEEFMAQMKRANISLFVVDEAHCVSEWGHNFRPDYLLLESVITQLGKPTILALTATATPWIREEIIERLGMRNPDVVVRDIDRPNLFFEVRRVRQEIEDKRVLHDLLLGEVDEYPAELGAKLRGTMQGSGIIYTATTRGAQETAEWLNSWGITADYYHGQRKKADRNRVQDAFMAGELQVIAATNAFGMGVDKPDVRFVIHRDIPASLEAYYQEAGRAGRDGELARCTLIYRSQDLGRAAFMAASGQLTREELEQAHARLIAYGTGPLSRPDFQGVTGLSKGDAARLISLLKRHGILSERRGVFRLLVPNFDPAQIPLDEEEHRRAYEQSRLDMMRGYVETRDCRRRYILNYFGEDSEGETCELCDNDTQMTTEAPVLIHQNGNGNGNGYHPNGNGNGNGHSNGNGHAAPFQLGERVAHELWGEGVVQRVAGDTLTVLFTKAGYKTLSTEIIAERGVLKKAE